VQQHIEWNPATQLWETEQADLFSGQQEPFSETWPTSGMTRNGQLLPLPTSAPPTAANESSSLLPTPLCMQDGGGPVRPDRPDLLHDGVVRGLELLPTPVAQQSGSSPGEHLARKPGRTQVTDLAIIVANGLM
jgi:hypothetical protein